MADDHKSILAKVRKQLAEIFEGSEQSVYIYLDEGNKVCNDNFASLLGYSSAKEWSAVKGDFAETFVTPKDRRTLVSAYQDAMDKLVGAAVAVRWRKKDGGEASTTTILVPLVFEGHRMAIHFISPSPLGPG